VPGPFAVRHLTYGSGKDLHRPEFGAKAALRTPTIDVSPFLHGWTGAAGRERTSYWGFDATAVPLQGYVPSSSTGTTP
jgi:hypothetical protein